MLPLSTPGLLPVRPLLKFASPYSIQILHQNFAWRRPKTGFFFWVLGLSEPPWGLYYRLWGVLSIVNPSHWERMIFLRVRILDCMIFPDSLPAINSMLLLKRERHITVRDRPKLSPRSQWHLVLALADVREYPYVHSFQLRGSLYL